MGASPRRRRVGGVTTDSPADAWTGDRVTRWLMRAEALDRQFAPVSAVLFAASATLWFMPELYAAILMDQPAWIQLALIVKIAVGGGIIFALRRQWTVWVA